MVDINGDDIREIIDNEIYLKCTAILFAAISAFTGVLAVGAWGISNLRDGEY